jgi:hypothetical protein
MIISIDTEKFWQNSTSLHDKNSEETRNRRNIPQHNKGCIWQNYSQYKLRSEIISSKVRNKTRASTSLTVIWYSTGIPSQSSNVKGKKEKGFK